MKIHFAKQSPSSLFWYFLADRKDGKQEIMKVNPASVEELAKRFEYVGPVEKSRLPRLKEI